MNRYTRQLIDKQLPKENGIRQFIIDVADLLDSMLIDEDTKSVLGEDFERMVSSLQDIDNEN